MYNYYMNILQLMCRTLKFNIQLPHCEIIIISEELYNFIWQNYSFNFRGKKISTYDFVNSFAFCQKVTSTLNEMKSVWTGDKITGNKQ